MSAMCVQTLFRKWRSCEMTIAVPCKPIEKILQPVDGFEIEVVGRLVEQQRFGTAEQGLRQQHAHLLAALQLAHFSIVQRFRDIEAVEQNRGVALGGVAVVFGDDAFEFAEPHAVFVGHVGLGVNLVALGKRVPQRTVAHDDRVDHAESVESKLILTQNAEALGADDGALLGVDLAREDLHEGGFAGTVRSGEAIAPSGKEGHGNVFKQDFGAVAHADIAYGNHGLPGG